MSDANDFNAHVVEEFRASKGQLGGQLAGMPALLLHTVGRRSGVERVNPLAYLELEGGWAVFASFAGAPRHPDWYLNVTEAPRTTVEVGADTVEVVARVATGAEREEIWERQKARMPIFAEYEEKAGSRVIPVVVLEPVS